MLKTRYNLRRDGAKLSVTTVDRDCVRLFVTRIRHDAVMHPGVTELVAVNEDAIA